VADDMKSTESTLGEY